ncbi:hypothetical protein V8G54_010041 [Vigna mungo]|uniref:AP complex mu/sigma subunit domain-containing protein n=1 Tax=Vigna mungo TaxID=3915 RepID=A0AAQ3S639_VIGMU
MAMEPFSMTMARSQTFLPRLRDDMVRNTSSPSMVLLEEEPRPELVVDMTLTVGHICLTERRGGRLGDDTRMGREGWLTIVERGWATRKLEKLLVEGRCNDDWERQERALKCEAALRPPVMICLPKAFEPSFVVFFRQFPPFSRPAFSSPSLTFLDSPGGGHSRWSWNRVPSRCVLVWESWARVRVVAALRASGVEGESPVEVWSLVTWCFRVCGSGGASSWSWSAKVAIIVLFVFENFCSFCVALGFLKFESSGCHSQYLPQDNELEVLEIIHHFVEILDRYFGSVSSVQI